MLGCCVAVIFAAACIPVSPAPTNTPSREEIREQPTPTPPAWQEPFTPVTLENVAELQFVGRLDPPMVDSGSIFAHAISADGTRLAGLNQQQLVVWDLITGEMVFAAPRGEIFRIYYSPDKTRLYGLTPAGTVRVLDGESGFEQGVFQLHPDFVEGQHTYYAPDGLLAANSIQGEIRVWDVVAQEVLVDLPTETADLTHLAFSADGARIAAGDANGNLQVWDWQAGEQIADMPDEEAQSLVQLAVAPGGEQVAAATNEDVRVWDVATASLEHILLTGEGGATDVLTYTPDGQYIVNSGFAEAMNIWGRGSGELVAVIPELGGEPTSAAFSPDGNLMLSSVFQGGVYIWDITTMNEDTLGRAELDTAKNIIDVAWSADGRTLALFAADGTVLIWGIPPLAVTEDAAP